MWEHFFFVCFTNICKFVHIKATKDLSSKKKIQTKRENKIDIHLCSRNHEYIYCVHVLFAIIVHVLFTTINPMQEESPKHHGIHVAV